MLFVYYKIHKKETKDYKLFMLIARVQCAIYLSVKCVVDTHYILCHFRSSALAAPPTLLLSRGMARWSQSGFAHTATCFMLRLSTATRPASKLNMSPKAQSPPQQAYATNNPGLCTKQMPHCSGKRNGRHLICSARLQREAMTDDRAEPRDTQTPVMIRPAALERLAAKGFNFRAQPTHKNDSQMPVWLKRRNRERG